MLKLIDGRTDLYQWDTGRKIAVDANCSQVHFSNKLIGPSIDVDVIDGEAFVPDILLQSDKELTAWAFVGTPENGYTKISKVFKVIRRNKPADYVFTPHEQTTLQKIMDAIEGIPEAIQRTSEEILREAKESGEFDGEPGVSITHSWNGTVLTITSASGTSSADLRGPAGDRYVLTDDDKAEIAQKVLAEIPDGDEVAY